MRFIFHINNSFLTSISGMVGWKLSCFHYILVVIPTLIQISDWEETIWKSMEPSRLWEAHGYPAFYGTRPLITMYTEGYLWSLFWDIAALYRL